jgi:hypothetical protein
MGYIVRPIEREREREYKRPSLPGIWKHKITMENCLPAISTPHFYTTLASGKFSHDSPPCQSFLSI